MGFSFARFSIPIKVERVKGIEPSFSAWEADVLPLNYTRLCRARYFIRFCPPKISVRIVVLSPLDGGREKTL